MKDKENEVVTIYDGRKITRVVYRNDFTFSFPFVISKISEEGEILSQRLMSATDQKIVLSLLACSKANNNEEIRLPYWAFQEITGIRSHNEDYEQFISKKLTLLTKAFIKNTDSELVIRPLFSGKTGVDKKAKMIIVNINPEHLGFFNNLNREFTIIVLKEAEMLTGKYTMVLYRLLIQWFSVGQTTIMMDDLAEQMCLSDSYLASTKDLTKKIIKPSIKELREKIPRFANLDFRYNSNRKPTGIMFSWDVSDGIETKENRKKIAKISKTINQVISNSTPNAVNASTDIHQPESDSVPVDSYIPTEDDIRNYMLVNDIDIRINIRRFIMYCRQKIQKNRNWNNAGCPHGWTDYFYAYIGDEGRFSGGTQQNQRVPMPDYMNRPIPESRPASQDMINRVKEQQRQMQDTFNDFNDEDDEGRWRW